MKKLKKILLINWLYFSKEIIEVGDVNFLTGKNGAGKSTVIDALQIVLLGETNARNFNQAANEKSQRSLDGYLRADMDENSPYSRRGKEFSTYIACEFYDDVKGASFVTGVVFDCRADGSKQDRFFIYPGTLPENCFLRENEAMEVSELRQFLKQNYKGAEIYDSQKEYRRNMLSRWNVHNEQVLRMMKKAVSFRPIVDIQAFITENICDIPEKPDITSMQQNIRDYKRHEQLAQRQTEKLNALRDIGQRYREMQQAIDRQQEATFLLHWAERAMQQAKLDRLTQEHQDAQTQLTQAENRVRQLTETMEKQEQRKRELERACEQSDVYQETERLRGRKKTLTDERVKLERSLQMLALNIRQEAQRIGALCEGVLSLEGDEALLRPVQDAAEAAHRAYIGLQGSDQQMFAWALEPFTQAQQAAEGLSNALQAAAYQVNSRIAALEAEKRQSQTALAGLRHNIKDYPADLLDFKAELSAALKRQTGRTVQLDILADVLEVDEQHERWRGAVEGYLNTQRFYLLIDPAWYNQALRIYDQLKQRPAFNAFGLVDVGKLREKENTMPLPNSLAGKVTTENELARTYVDYLLGRVICCDTVEELRNYSKAITAEGMVYQGYVARSLRRQMMADTFIGRRAVELRTRSMQAQVDALDAQLKVWDGLKKQFAQPVQMLFTPYFVQHTVQQGQADYARTQALQEEIVQVDETLGGLDLTWVDQQRVRIAAMEKELKAQRAEKDQETLRMGQFGERLRQLEQKELPEQTQALARLTDVINESFTTAYQQEVGLPRYEQELAQRKRPETIVRVMNSQAAAARQTQQTAQEKLFSARRAYADRFGPCAFRIDSMENGEYEAAREELEKIELPKYREKITAARESAMEQFQNDFLARLKSSIDQVQAQVKSLNQALRRARFGTDSYQFRVERNPDYADYYDMIMAPELMEGDSLLAQPFQQKYGPLIDRLFSLITASDDTQMNSQRQSELQQNIVRYTDFRTYLKFDLETTDQNGSRQLLSQTLNTKSGGETQTPFYIAVLASFAQLYRVNDPSDNGNTVRLVVFDEAFNKMDSDRITESVRLLRQMGLQAIICTPPDKVADIMPIADRTLLVSKEKYHMHILPFAKERAQ